MIRWLLNFLLWILGLSRGDPPSYLDRVMFKWPDKTPFTVRDMTRSLSIMGAPGSGKSSGSGLHFAKAIFALGNSGGLIIASKPEDLKFWTDIAAKTGRSDDLLVFSPKHQHRMNFLDTIGGDAREKCDTLLQIGDVLKRGESRGGGEDGGFWQQQKERALLLGITMLTLADEPVTGPNLQSYIVTAANSAVDLRDKEGWQKNYHNQINQRAFTKEKDPIQQFDYEQCTAMWLKEWPFMNDKTRSNILAEVMGILFVFNSGIVRELVSTTSSIHPDLMGKGKFILVDMPLKTYGESGRFVAAGFKYICQRWILARHVQEGDGLAAIWSDEFQNIMSPYDTVSVDEFRSHLGCMIVLTQSLQSYYRAMPGEKGKAYSQGFLAAIGCKIFHTLNDPDSAQFASRLLGDYLESKLTLNPNKDVDIVDALLGNSEHNASFTSDWKPILQANVFQGGMATGGPKHKMLVEGYVIQAEIFNSGRRWLRVAFDQRI